jgi:hypothetical protein
VVDLYNNIAILEHDTSGATPCRKAHHRSSRCIKGEGSKNPPLCLLHFPSLPENNSSQLRLYSLFRICLRRVDFEPARMV